METVKYNKWKSRTFWLVAAWTSFVPLGILAAVILGATVVIPTGTLVTIAGTITALYIAGEKGKNAILAKNGKLG